MQAEGPGFLDLLSEQPLRTAATSDAFRQANLAHSNQQTNLAHSAQQT